MELAVNRQATFKFAIEERFTAGLVLVGTEVKSIREGHIQINDAFVGIEGGEAFLYNCHVSPYERAGYAEHDPGRKRKLLLKKDELLYLDTQLRRSGQTLVVLKVFVEKRWIKLELGLGRGKKTHDQRQSIREKEAKRDVDQALRRRR